MKVYLEIETERISGRFISRDDIVDTIITGIEALGELDIEDSVYEVVNVAEIEPPKKPMKYPKPQ